MDLWEIESSFQRAASIDQNGATTYAEMAKENLSRSCSLEQLPTPGKRGEFPSIKVTREAHQRGLNQNKFNLACRLDFQKISIAEARVQAITLWKPKGTCRMIPVGKGYITIFLDNEEDLNKIWSGGPWVIGKQLLRLSPWSPFFDPEKQQNTHALVWVKFPGLGVEFWEVDTLMVIGRTLGTPIQVDQSSTTMEFGYFAKVLVDIDLAEPTPDKILVDSEATPVLLNNEDALIYVDHATPSHGHVEARGRSASPDNPHQLLKETAIIQLQSALKWADMVEDVERDSALINYEEVRKKSGKNRQVHLMKNTKKKNVISAIHGLAYISARRALWTDMESITNLNLPWLAIVDFNCIRSWDERSGGTGPLPCSITYFNYCIDACSLTESFSSGPKYSWCNNQKGRARILKRLDRALYNNAWISKFDGWSCKYLPKDISDHSALVGSTQCIPKSSNIPFRFLTGWVTVSSFRDLAINSWSESLLGDPLYVLMKKLQRLKAAIKTWKKENLGGLRSQIDTCVAYLADIQI
ncbi:hypothetical protein GIB67_001497 [Kingdonia uniflora]|uniref:DUF4283 domain-containing protein n=1 Tax=Kingdonia uniflora TaxID=39325 RepID=A0A7J7MNQ0_9MAGN|nr:hypothetical protein GIB67_001497 [Kingdonia uniflora]